MTTDTALIEKREELKRRLAAGEYKTLIDVFLEGTNRLIHKITRRTKPVPLWLITVILGLALNLVGVAGVYIAGDLLTFRKIIESLGLGYGFGFLFIISISILYITTTITINQYISRILALWRDNILDATNSVASLEEFEIWLNKTCNWRMHLLVTISAVLLLGLYGTSVTETQLGVSSGYGLIFSLFIGTLFGYTVIYLLLMVVLLSASLRRYDLKLFAADPGSSELISRLSGELGFFVYYVAGFAAILTLGTSWLGYLRSFRIILALLYWLPIIAMFILNQTGLSSIIRRAKWKTLNEIQGKVEKLQSTENFEDKETMDTINRLMDYHDRVKATRDSALDFRTYLGFINSLLLPLLAFILGNLDFVFRLFGRNP